MGRPGPPAALTGARHPDQGRARAPTALQPGTLCHSAGDPPPPRPEPPRTAGSTESWGFQLLRRGPSAGIPFPLGLFGVYGSFTEGSRTANPRGRARPAGGAGNRRRERPRSGSRSPTGQSWEPALRPAAARDGSRRPALPPPAGPPGLLRAQLRPELWGRPASPLQEGPAPGPTGPCLAPPGPPTRGWPPSKAGLRAPAAPPLLRAGARGAGAGRPRDKHSRGSEETPSQRWPPGWQDGPAGPPAGVGGAPRLLRPPGLRSEPGRVRHHPWPREAELQPCCAGDTGQETPADGVAGQEVCRSEAGAVGTASHVLPPHYCWGGPWLQAAARGAGEGVVGPRGTWGGADSEGAQHGLSGEVTSCTDTPTASTSPLLPLCGNRAWSLSTSEGH